MAFLRRPQCGIVLTPLPWMQIGTLQTRDRTPVHFDGDFLLVLGQNDVQQTLIRLALDDIYANQRIVFIDFEGESVDHIVSHTSQERRAHLLMFSMDQDRAIGFNPLAFTRREKAEVAKEIVSAFGAVWDYDNPTPQLNMYLYAACLSLLHTDDGSLYKVPFLFLSDIYRTYVKGHLKDNPILKLHWENYEKLKEREQATLSAPVLNRFLPLITDKRIGHVIGQGMSFTDKFDGSVLIRLPIAELGEEWAHLLANLILTRLPAHKVYAAQPFPIIPTRTLIQGASHLSEIPRRQRDRILAKSGVVAFRLGPGDARTLEGQFDIPPQDVKLTELLPGQAYAAFDRTYLLYMPPHGYARHPKPQKVRERSLSQYGTPKADVEKRLQTFLSGLDGEPKKSVKSAGVRGGKDGTSHRARTRPRGGE